jgi:hypothetical protein
LWLLPLSGLAALCFSSGRHVAKAQGGPETPPASSGYTLKALYDFVVSNGQELPPPGSHALRPTGAPGEIDMPTVEDIIQVLQARLPCAQGGGGVLPATGQTLCYDALGNVIDCSGSICPGQDGFYREGCRTQPRYVDNGDGTVTDNCTGLMWQKHTADTNGDGTVSTSDAVLWCDAQSHSQNATFAGHDDWRLPNLAELLSIVDHGRSDPAIDPLFSAALDRYWSSTSYALDPRRAWAIVFSYGTMAHNAKQFGTLDYVRLVRSAR